MTYIPGGGPMGAKIMVLKECPTDKDIAAGKMTLGRETETLMRDAGIQPSSCWISAVSKFQVPSNPNKKKKIPFHVRGRNAGVDVDQQLQELQVEINSLQPNIILGLGRTSLWALHGRDEIDKFRGSILLGMGRKFIPTYNPEHLNWGVPDPEFVGYWNRQIIAFDFKRLLRQSYFPEIVRPTRTLEVCANSYHLAEFLNRYKDKSRMSVDIEAGGSYLPICIGLSLDRSHGMCVPLWNEEGISTIPTADLIQMWILVANALWEKLIVGQNINYDRDKIKRLGFIIRKLVSDVMLKAQAINPELPKGLAFNTSLYTEEPYYKDEGMYHGKLHDLFIGCARDACVTLEIDEEMDADLDEIGQRPFFENFLMELPDFYWAIEQQGFRINPVQRDILLRKYIEWDERLRYELFQLVGTEINVASPKQVALLLFENFKLPPKSGTGEEEITELLNSPTAIKVPEQRRVCELILEDRRVRKSISTYLMALPDYDGRMRTTYFPCLDTGRSSTGQQDEPIRPTVEVIDENGKKKNKPMGIAFQTMTKHGDIGADIRSMYVPDDFHYEWVGHHYRKVMEEELFIQADSSQAEARVVWLLADDEEALRLVDEIDYHALTASWFFGGTERDYSKKVLGFESPIRFAGKTLRHAGHLGAGKRRASISVNTDARKYKIPIQISEQVAGKALEIFHAKQPKIQRVFQNGIVEALKKTRTLHASVPYAVGAKFGGRRTFFERWGEELFRQAFSYIPQRSVSDNTKAAGLRIRARIPDIKIVMEAHDALLFSVPVSKVKAYAIIIREEFERPIDFSHCSIPRRDLVIPCEIETGLNYQEFRKFKDFPTIEPIPEVAKTVQEQFYVR
jgi:DNA polymerase I-like protein with 3'-5' exonuclease and polymerase domains/uracil-DNA glycosylase